MKPFSLRWWLDIHALASARLHHSIQYDSKIDYNEAADLYIWIENRIVDKYG